MSSTEHEGSRNSTRLLVVQHWKDHMAKRVLLLVSLLDGMMCVDIGVGNLNLRSQEVQRSLKRFKLVNKRKKIHNDQRFCIREKGRYP